jgi:hypothetical protein
LFSGARKGALLQGGGKNNGHSHNNLILELVNRLRDPRV